MYGMPQHNAMDPSRQRSIVTSLHIPAGKLAALAALLTVLTLPTNAAAEQASPDTERPAALRLLKYGASARAFHVVSTLIVGPSESILFDAQYKVSDGRRLAEMIAETGTDLKAIVLSHADHDHYMGAMEIIRRFPETPVYMSEAGIKDFNARAEKDLATEKSRGDQAEVPDSLVAPQPFPPDGLIVDGQEIVVIDGLVGDVRKPASTALWIPSLRTILAGDLVFEGIHPWLGDSDVASRVEWRNSLRKLQEYQPKAVVPGHKRNLTTPDAPRLIELMIDYLGDYDAQMETATSPEELVGHMVFDHPDRTLAILMAYGARMWFKK